MHGLPGLAIAEDYIRFAVEDRLDQSGDIGLWVLVVAIGSHDDVGAELQRSIERGSVRGGEAPVTSMAYHVIRARSTRDVTGFVSGSVVHDQHLHAVYAFDLTWNAPDDSWEILCLVEAGDLDDDFGQG